MKKLIRKTFKRRHRGPQVINQAVNMEKETIFIAIPKTGTTSVRSQLTQPGVPIVHNPHINICQVRDLLYVYQLKITLGKNEQFPNPDVPDDQTLRERAERMFTSYFKFSAVRNPWARAVSLYYRREGVKEKAVQHMTFEKFCEQHLYASDTCRQPTRHQNQVDWLCDEKGEMMMDYIYKVEEFEQAIAEIRERTNGRVQLEHLKKNINPKSRSGDYQNLYNAHTRQLIASQFEKDIDLFKYVF